jgi:hypothetical protein
MRSAILVIEQLDERIEVLALSGHSQRLGQTVEVPEVDGMPLARVNASNSAVSLGRLSRHEPTKPSVFQTSAGST